MSDLLLPTRGGRGMLERVWNVPFDSLEFREPNSTNDQSPWYTVTGHAAVFGQVTTLYKSKTWQITEEIDAAAFDNVLASAPDVHFNVNHDMNRVLARTGVKGVGQLDLGTDFVGLRMHSRFSQKLSYAQDLAELMRTRVVDQMSFAFQIAREQMVTTQDEHGFETDHYTILEVGALYDVCVCPQGAYSTTDAVLHARFATSGRAVDSAGRPLRNTDQSESGGAEDLALRAVNPAGDENAAVRKRRLELLRLKALQHFPEPKEPQ